MASSRHTSPIARLEPAAPSPAHPLPDPRERSLRLKHSLDRLGAAVAILVSVPLFLIAALYVKASGAERVLVRDRRIDRHGRSFDLLAFPSLPILRRWSIEQLPQLLNILRGEMSFVGPRPERPEFVELFGGNLRRHDQPRRVRPGVTGWSQLRGLMGGAPLAERVRWDDWYVENWSLRLDARILFRTVRDVCSGIAAASDE